METSKLNFDTSMMDMNKSVENSSRRTTALRAVEGTTNQETSNNKVQKKESAGSVNGYDERIDKLVNQVNDKFKVFNREIKYDVHKETKRYIVTVTDSETGDVIKEIPSKESLDLFAKMLEMAGLLVDEKS